MPITARMILDSIGQHSPRLTTMFARYPKFIHAEHLRHRAFSFSVSSSRAIPVARNLEEVRSDELRAAPVWWGREVKGMASGDELDDSGMETVPLYSGSVSDYLTPKKAAQRLWRRAAHDALATATELNRIGVHKSIVNRVLEPFLHVNVIVTGCEPGWMNFFGLRLDKAAQPEMRVLAEAMWREWNESKPQKLEPGQWHLPFISSEDWFHSTSGDPRIDLDRVIKVSAGRCANLSYRGDGEFEPLAVDKALALGERLQAVRPIHASPFEHQSTPDQPTGRLRLVWHGEGKIAYDDNGRPYPVMDEFLRYIPKGLSWEPEWAAAEQHGNLPGWVQFRKTLPGETIAELPEAYR